MTVKPAVGQAHSGHHVREPGAGNAVATEFDRTGLDDTLTSLRCCFSRLFHELPPSSTARQTSFRVSVTSIQMSTAWVPPCSPGLYAGIQKVESGALPSDRLLTL